MKNMNFKLLKVSFLPIFAIVISLAACGGGGKEEKAPVLPPGANEGFRPFITSVSPSVANPGDEITITGKYFGITKQDSTVTLNSLPLTVTSWSDTEIKAILPPLAESGIIVVTVRGRSSQSSASAQIFIGKEPVVGSPIVTGLSQSSGYPGIVLIVYGQNFGEPRPSDGKVLFRSSAGEIEATVKPIEGAEGRYQWYNNSIQVLVPEGAISGPVVVSARGQRSNENFFFQVEPAPPPPPTEPVTITSFSPTEGPVGTVVSIRGSGFGHSRGAGVVRIGGANVEVVFWSNVEIFVKVTPEARTGDIEVVARGKSGRTGSPFTVIHTPIITGVSPAEIHAGRPFVITGKNFGLEAGSISFTPQVPAGTPAEIAQRQRITTISSSGISSWTDERIEVNQLPRFNSDAGIPLLVTVTNSIGQSSDDPTKTSDDVIVTLVTDVFGKVEVFVDVGTERGEPNPRLVPQTIGLAGASDGTEFIFVATVGGGSPSYQLEFNLGSGSPKVVTGVETTGETSIRYPSEGEYDVFVKATDSRGDTAIIQGPTITIFESTEPVITRMFVSAAPPQVPVGSEFMANDYVGEYFGSALGIVWNFDADFIPVITELAKSTLGVPQEGQYARRSEQAFIALMRPYGYRVYGGSKLTIEGYNLDAGDSRTVLLATDSGFSVPVQLAAPPSAVSLLLSIPSGLEGKRTLGGAVQVVYQFGADQTTVSPPTPLVLAPEITPPPENVSITGTMSIPVIYDPVPSTAAGDFIGTRSYLFFVFPAVFADQDDPRYGQPYGNFRCYLGFDISDRLTPPSSSNVQFDIYNNVSRWGWYARDPAYPQTSSTPYTVVAAVPGTWYMYLWSGVKDSLNAEEFARSGIISNAAQFTVVP